MVRKNILRINDNGNTIIYTPFDSFSLKPILPFNHKYKRPVKKQTKTLLQQNPLLNETDLDSDDDPIFKRIPNTPNSQSSEINKPIISIPLDPQLQQELVYKLSVAKLHSLAITPTPIKPNSTNNVIPYFDLSFFEHAQECTNFFLPPKTPLTIQNSREQQNLDLVFSIVYEWIKSKTEPDTLNPSIKGNSFFSH